MVRVWRIFILILRRMVVVIMVIRMLDIDIFGQFIVVFEVDLGELVIIRVKYIIY